MASCRVSAGLKLANLASFHCLLIGPFLSHLPVAAVTSANPNPVRVSNSHFRFSPNYLPEVSHGDHSTKRRLEVDVSGTCVYRRHATHLRGEAFGISRLDFFQGVYIPPGANGAPRGYAEAVQAGRGVF